MQLPQFLTAVLAVGPIVASAHTFRPYRRDTAICNIQLASSSGGRKVAIVIDSSGSMLDNDPGNLRIQAGKSLNRQLIAGSDQVAVVDFDGGADVIYPLGNPAGADGSFNSIDSDGSTNIAAGVKAAVGELTKGGAAKDIGGIVVLTDGEDSSVTNLIKEIDAARAAGIRVSFGFLAPSSSFFQPTLLQAILKTGGTYGSFASAAAIEPFLFLILSNGLTASDRSANNADQPLLSGITIAKLSGSQAVTFSYAAQAGEGLRFTLESLSNQALDAVLNGPDGTEVAKNATVKAGRKLETTLSYKADKAGTLKLIVSSTNATADGVFQVSLNSTLGISGCSLNSTLPPNATVTGGPGPSATSTNTPVVTAGATRLMQAGSGFLALVAAALLL